MALFYEHFIKRETVEGMIFDVDGTLLDSMPVWSHSGERYLATLGIFREDFIFHDNAARSRVY